MEPKGADEPNFDAVALAWHEIDDTARIAIVTLNRPGARNAISPDLAEQLPLRIRQADGDPSTRAIVLTGADPAFCAGFDLGDVGSGKKKGTNPHPGYWGALPPTRVPVIGAINGAAVTGGLEIALACDFLVASDRARFADTHAKVGMIPGWGLTVLLPALIGPGRARRMSSTSEFIDAHRALEWGLVTEIVEHDRLLERTLQIATTIAGNNGPAVSAIRNLYREVATLGEGDEAFAVENRRAREWAAHRAAERSERI